MSNFWENDHLQNTQAKTVITKLKYHCIRYGIPVQVVIENRAQFSGHEFATFLRKWYSTYTPISPYNGRENGKIESAVKMAKNLLQKTMEYRADPYLAIPVQKLMSRTIK